MSAPNIHDLVTGAGQQVSHALALAGPVANQVLAKLQQFTTAMNDTAVYGAFPLCLTLAILHEQYRSIAESTPFRVGNLAARVVAVVAAYIGFSYVVSIILHLAGAGSGWLEWNQVGDLIGNDRLNPLNYNSTDVDITEPRTLGVFLLSLGCWFIMVLSILFAYVAGMFLSLIQGAFIAIIIPVGPLCIMASLIPGVGIAKSWARSLAQVAAWSTLASVITGLLLNRQSLDELMFTVGRADCGGMVRGAGRFLVYGLATWSIPLIAGKIMSGAAPAASAIGGAFATGVLGARAVLGGVTGVAGGARDGAGKALGTGAGAAAGMVAGGGEQGVRPHKVGFVRTAVGAVVGAALAPAGMLLGREQRKRGDGKMTAGAAGKQPGVTAAQVPGSSAARSHDNQPLASASPVGSPKASRTSDETSASRHVSPAADRHGDAKASDRSRLESRQEQAKRDSPGSAAAASGEGRLAAVKVVSMPGGVAARGPAAPAAPARTAGSEGQRPAVASPEAGRPQQGVQGGQPAVASSGPGKAQDGQRPPVSPEKPGSKDRHPVHDAVTPVRAVAHSGESPPANRHVKRREPDSEHAGARPVLEQLRKEAADDEEDV
jgi:hypothetical protein